MKTRRFPTPSALALPLLLLAGCQDSSVPGLSPDVAVQAKSSGGTDTDSRAILVWADLMPDGVTVTGIQGDGRNVDGGTTGTVDAYRGDRCGVRAKIFWYDPDFSRSGDLVFDPDFDRAGSCATRKLHFDLDRDPATPATALGPFTNLRQIMQVAASRAQVLRFTSTGIANCEAIRFGDADPSDPTGVHVVPGSTGGVLATRTAGAVGSTAAGSWTVETRDGVGRCMVTSKGKYVDTNQTYTLPFSFTVTEVQYPY